MPSIEWFDVAIPVVTTIVGYVNARKRRWPLERTLASILLGFVFGVCASAAGYFHHGPLAITAFVGCLVCAGLGMVLYWGDGKRIG